MQNRRIEIVRFLFLKHRNGDEEWKTKCCSAMTMKDADGKVPIDLVEKEKDKKTVEKLMSTMEK